MLAFTEKDNNYRHKNLGNNFWKVQQIHKVTDYDIFIIFLLCLLSNCFQKAVTTCGHRTSRLEYKFRKYTNPRKCILVKPTTKAMKTAIAGYHQFLFFPLAFCFEKFPENSIYSRFAPTIALCTQNLPCLLKTEIDDILSQLGRCLGDSRQKASFCMVKMCS